LCLGGSNFILHCRISSTLNKSLLCGTGFMESDRLVLYSLIFQIFVTACPC
jgi:hypothetical protein